MIPLVVTVHVAAVSFSSIKRIWRLREHLWTHAPMVWIQHHRKYLNHEWRFHLHPCIWGGYLPMGPPFPSFWRTLQTDRHGWVFFAHDIAWSVPSSSVECPECCSACTVLFWVWEEVWCVGYLFSTWEPDFWTTVTTNTSASDLFCTCTLWINEA